jgi:hypothetical protein
MKAKQTITASVALAGIAVAWWQNHQRHVCERRAALEHKQMQEALETFEGEGGLVST